MTRQMLQTCTPPLVEMPFVSSWEQVVIFLFTFEEKQGVMSCMQVKIFSAWDKGTPLVLQRSGFWGFSQGGN